jgi:hypothetical protein
MWLYYIWASQELHTSQESKVNLQLERIPLYNTFLPSWSPPWILLTSVHATKQHFIHKSWLLIPFNSFDKHMMWKKTSQHVNNSLKC